jgi:negative regulator of sigma E activity
MQARRVENNQAPGSDPFELQLSCLLDGEVDEAECRRLLERLRRDDGAGRSWELMNCVGDAMRSADVAAWHRPGFVAKVAGALEQEPTVLAPAAARRPGGMRRWLLPGAGVAVAAAVLLAVGLPGQVTPPADLAQRAPAGAPAQSSFTAGRLDVARLPALERHLAAHRELADSSLMPNSTPYVRTSGALLVQEGR